MDLVDFYYKKRTDLNRRKVLPNLITESTDTFQSSNWGA